MGKPIEKAVNEFVNTLDVDKERERAIVEYIESLPVLWRYKQESHISDKYHEISKQHKPDVFHKALAEELGKRLRSNPEPSDMVKARKQVEAKHDYFKWVSITPPYYDDSRLLEAARQLVSALDELKRVERAGTD